MTVRFSPASEFPGSAGNAPGSVRPMKRFSIASKRFLIAARSAFESGEVAASLLDILTLAFLAFFVVVFFGAAGWSFFILGTAAF
jgi:hypothetical protein